MKRKSAIFLVSCLLFAVLLCGCSIYEPEPSTFPVMTGVDTSGMTLTEIETEQIITSYEEDGWTVLEGADFLTLVMTETMEDSHVVNVTVQVSSEYEGPFTAKDRNNLYRVFSASGYTVFDRFELRRLDDEVVVYIEAVTEFTDKLIDKLIKEGMLTESSLEAMGGRETLLAYPKTYQTMIYAIRDGCICVYTGTCYSRDHIQSVLDQILILLDNTKVISASVK